MSQRVTIMELREGLCRWPMGDPRGVSEKEAHRLVVHGFFNDLIRKVGIPSIEDKLLRTVEAELAKNLLKEA